MPVNNHGRTGGDAQQAKPTARPDGQAEEGAGGTQWDGDRGAGSNPCAGLSVGAAATGHEQAMECSSQSFL